MRHRSKPPATRHVVSINDLTNKEIELIFEEAQFYLKNFGDPAHPYRIARSTDLASNCILATLFYEPSTRTRLSFESAMARLGGKSITSADPRTSSAAKGETIADSVRVISNYADIIVMRHPRDGAARLAAEYSSIPVINGGDGSHEHPTQTLCDLFTLQQKHKSFTDLTIAISGDLKGSRTIHSFVYALARFGANIALSPAAGMGLPANVDTRLREEFGRQRADYVGNDTSIDAWYIGPDQPHQLSLIPSADLVDPDLRTQQKIEKIAQTIHFMYVTRFQKERRSGEQKQDYPRVDAKFLGAPMYSKTSVLHPLPRVDELDVSFDSDRRALYFQQAAYGVPVRMALIAFLLGLRNRSLQRFDGGFARPDSAVYEQPIGFGISCANENCIVNDEHEKHQAKNRFYLVSPTPGRAPKLRCMYCESDMEEAESHPFVVAQKSKGTFSFGLSQLKKIPQDRMKDFLIFANETDAVAQGFRRKDRSARNYLNAS
jgi:aspartate carbamoyltransferase catalytic subunit